jgi:4-azaleucine resistance transporter AzlC
MNPTANTEDFGAAPDRPPGEPFPQRAEITRAAVGIGLYAGAFGMTFGAVSVGSGLSLAQTMLLSAVMFTGASQFAFVGVIAAGGSPFAAIPAALLLGLRNAFYGVPVTEILHPRGLARLWTAHFVIDETTAMAVAQATPRARRYAFWATGSILFTLWVIGSLAGGLIGSGINTPHFGLDAAAPAVFLALLWPQLIRPRAPAVALLGALVALALIPIAPAGVPVIAAASVAIVAGITGRTENARRSDEVTDGDEAQ